MSIEVKIEYFTYHPTKGLCPRVWIISGEEDEYHVQFVNRDNNDLVFTGICKTGKEILGARQWFTNWRIRILKKDGTLVYVDDFDPTGKTVFVKIDAYALGDNLAWMPYVEEFGQKYNAKMICSTFFNSMLAPVYPDILFVAPNTRVRNVYAQYYIGANEEENFVYSPVNSRKVPLQSVAATMLGLPFQERRPRIPTPNVPKGKYVCISEFASDEKKHWKAEGGWQKLVDHIKSLGYEVRVISKEETSLEGVTNLTGNIKLVHRIREIAGAELFIGVSSGLSWLAWGVGTHVVLVSDVTPEWHEFQTGVTRLIKNPKKMVDYTPTEPTSFEEVRDAVSKLLTK